MHSGIVAKVESDFSTEELSSLDSRQAGEFELKQGIDIKRPIAGVNGKSAYEGQAATEMLETIETIEYSENSLYTTEIEQKHSIITDFLLLIGEFVVVNSSKGEFLFDILSRKTKTKVERVEFDLDAFYSNNQEAKPWMAGFYGLEGNTNNGVIYGQNVSDDSIFGDMIDESNHNQLGLESYAYNDLEIKLRLTESGYIEIYQPSNFESEDLVQFIMSELFPYIV